jgi:putative flippase GtrA
MKRLIAAAKRPAIAEMLRFAVVGAFNTGFTIGLIALLRAETALSLAWSSVLAFASATLISFLLNQIWTFRHARNRRPLAQRIALFVASNVVSGAAYVGAVLALAGVMPELAAATLAVAVSFAVNFLVSKTLVFA